MSAKIQLMQIAATLTAGIVSNLPDQLPKAAADGKLSPDVQADNLLAWECMKVVYGGLVANFNDKAAFPDPPPEANVGGGSAKIDPAGLLEHPAVKALLEKLVAKV